MSELSAIQSNDRETAEPVVNTVALTTYHETVGSTTSDTNVPDLPFSASTYDKDPTSDTLGRDYLLQEFVWDSDTPMGTAVATITLPHDLIEIPYNLRRIGDFSQFKADAVLTVRINSNKYQAGTLMVSRLPYTCLNGVTPAPPTDDPNQTRLTDIYSRSQQSSIVLSAVSPQAVSFDMPWVCPKPTLPVLYYDMQAARNRFQGYGGTAVITVLNPIIEVGSADTSCRVSIYGRFKDAELYFPQPNTIIAQSGRETKQKSEQTGLVKEAMSKAKPVLDSLPEFVSSAAKAFAAVAPYLSLLGLNKPMSIKTTQQTTDATHPWIVNGAGTEVGTLMGMSPTASLSVSPKVFREDERLALFADICKHPTLVGVRAFDSTSASGATLFYFPVSHFGMNNGGTTLHSPYSGWYSQFFNYHRGSIRYRLHFHTSSFLKCRVRICLSQTPNHAFGSGLDFTDAPNMVVDITGDTYVDFVVPWSYYRHYMRTPTSLTGNPNYKVVGSAFASIGVILLDPLTSPTAVNPGQVYCNIWQSSCDDLQYMAPALMWHTNVGLSCTSPTTPFAQFDSRAVFREKCEPIVPAKPVLEDAICSGDHVRDIYTMLKRPVWPDEDKINNKGLALSPTIGSSAWHDSHGLLCAPFMFWRGGIRILTRNITVPTEFRRIEERYRGEGAQIWMDGMEGAEIITQNYATMEIPYESDLSFMEVIPNMDGRFRNTMWVYPAFPELYYSVADDFSLGWLSNTPTFTTTADPEVVPETTIVSQPQTPARIL